MSGGKAASKLLVDLNDSRVRRLKEPKPVGIEDWEDVDTSQNSYMVIENGQVQVTPVVNLPRDSRLVDIFLLFFTQ